MLKRNIYLTHRVIVEFVERRLLPLIVIGSASDELHCGEDQNVFHLRCNSLKNWYTGKSYKLTEMKNEISHIG